MTVAQIDDYARRLYTARGDRAEFEAAQRARTCAAKGEVQTAEQWRAVRTVIHMLRGPNAS